MIRKTFAAGCCAVALVVGAAPHARGADPPAHVVIVTLAGFGWDTLSRAQTPVLRKLIDDGSVAAVSVRAATRGSTPMRGYLTLGAGNRALVEAETRPRRDVHAGQVALRAADRFESGTAGEAMARRVVRPRTGEVVVPDVPAVDAAQRQISYGTEVGALGEALVRNGVRRAFVGAGDLADDPRQRMMRRGAALSIVDRSGTIDSGTVDGLVRPSSDAAFGVETDPRRFAAAVASALASAQVVVVEPGEMLRADEFALDAEPREADAQHRRALERTDVLVGTVVAQLSERDRLYIVGVSSPLDDPHDHLTLAIGYGSGITRGGWLTSATTHRRGMVTMTDFAPTVLSAHGIETPKAMSGTSIRSVESDVRDRVGALASLDAQSRFGDRFQGIATKLVVSLLAAIALALAGMIWFDRRRWRAVLAWLSLAALAVPTTAYLVRVLRVDRVGIVAATVIACAITALLATVVRSLPVAGWKAALVLIGLSFGWTTGDLLAGAPLQVNNVFGYSPISAGRFYGNSNVAFAVFVATTLLGVFGVLEIYRKRTIPIWAVFVFVAAIVIQGLPQFGADFGGVAASVPAMLVAYAVARGRRVRLWRIGAWAAAGAIAAVAVALVDAARPPQARTHLGRFAADLVSGGGASVADVITRKVQSNFEVLGSAWVWTVPLAVVAAVLLLRMNARFVQETARTRPMLAAGLAGTLAAGVVGFALNDTGIWVLGMTLAFVVPVAVLLATEARAPIRAGRIVSTDGLAHVQGSAQTAGSRGQDRPQE